MDRIVLSSRGLAIAAASILSAGASACIHPKCTDYHDPACWSPPVVLTDGAPSDAGDTDGAPSDAGEEVDSDASAPEALDDSAVPADAVVSPADATSEPSDS